MVMAPLIIVSALCAAMVQTVSSIAPCPEHKRTGLSSSNSNVDPVCFLQHSTAIHSEVSATAAGSHDVKLFLEECVASVSSGELDVQGASYGNEHQKTTSGKHIRCLAQRPETKSMAVLFYGYPGPNGVTSAALGLRAKSQTFKLVTAEADPDRCKQGKDYLRKVSLDSYVDLKCGIVCKGLSEEECTSYFRQRFCPAGRLDVMTVDFSLAVPPRLYRSALRGCAPRILFVENSGLDFQLYGTSESDSFSSGSESAPESWHHFEDHLHRRSSNGHGCFKLAVDRHQSGFVGDDGQAPRRFSVYVAARACTDEDLHIT